MAKYRFEQIAINSTEKKKPTEEDRFTYLGLEHLDSGCLKVSRFGQCYARFGYLYRLCLYLWHLDDIGCSGAILLARHVLHGGKVFQFGG